MSLRCLYILENYSKAVAGKGATTEAKYKKTDNAYHWFSINNKLLFSPPLPVILRK